MIPPLTTPLTWADFRTEHWSYRPQKAYKDLANTGQSARDLSRLEPVDKWRESKGDHPQSGDKVSSGS